MSSRRVAIVAALGSTQTLAWASSYYLPAIIGGPVAASLHQPRSVFFGIFSASLLLSAVIGPAVGRMIDQHGGRAVLASSNLAIAAGLVIMATAQGVVGLAVAWLFLAVGISAGLYDSAFAALTALYGRDARNAITGITLIAGFASTIGWPATAWFDHEFGWRGACLIGAGLNLGLGMPVNWLMIPATRPRHEPASASPQPAEVGAAPRGAMAILAFYFSAVWFVTGAMASHLPHLLMTAGASPTAAIAAAALVGPAQVAARLVEFGLMRNLHPLVSARVAAVLHPIGAGLLSVFGAPAAVAFAVLHGAGNGMITIAKGTLPLAIFGPVGYGLRNGMLSAPARVTQAAAPFLFGLLLDRYGDKAVVLSAGLCLAAAASLLLLAIAPRLAER